jgi:hypothetical protein
MELETLLVDGLQSEEHVVQPQPLPVGEDLTILHENVAAGLQVVLLLDPPALQFAADGVAMLGLDEGHVVHQEDVGFANPRHVLGRRLRR